MTAPPWVRLHPRHLGRGSRATRDSAARAPASRSRATHVSRGALALRRETPGVHRPMAQAPWVSSDPDDRAMGANVPMANAPWVGKDPPTIPPSTVSLERAAPSL